MRHTMRVKVYYEDTDASGLMYHASHIRLMERARTDLLAERGISVAQLHERGLFFVVTRIDIRYRSPARLGDMLTVEAELKTMKRVSMDINQRIIKGEAVVAEAIITIAMRDSEGLVRIPEGISGGLGKG